MPSAQVFISYASEDRSKVALPLADELQNRGFAVWIDQFSLGVGDPLLASIDAGLRECDAGVVVLSPHFFAKRWPARELSGLFAREEDGGAFILPVWHEVDAVAVRNESPVLADRIAVSTNVGINAVVDALVKALRKRLSGHSSGSSNAYVVGMAIRGTTLVDIVTQNVSRELVLPEGAPVSVQLYEDGSGINDSESFVECQSGVLRVISEVDIQAALRRLPAHPPGWDVVDWSISEADQYELDRLARRSEKSRDVTVDLKEIQRVQYIIALNPQLVADDEAVKALDAYVNFPTWWPDKLHRSLWEGYRSFGRRLLRRLANLDVGHRIAHLIGSDTHYGYRSNYPRKDHRQWQLANAILREFTADQLQSTTQLGAAIASPESGLDGVWRLALERKVAGDPQWDRHRFNFGTSESGDDDTAPTAE